MWNMVEALTLGGLVKNTPMATPIRTAASVARTDLIESIVYPSVLHSPLSKSYFKGIIIRMEFAMIKLKVTTIGSSAGIVLPKEALALLKVQKGDSVFLTESPDGLRITPYDPEFEEDMNLARQVMRKRRDLLRELAK
jgi:putative addiction module antidote